MAISTAPNRRKSDPLSYSLYKGDGFFPTEANLQAHLKVAPATVEKVQSLESGQQSGQEKIQKHANHWARQRAVQSCIHHGVGGSAIRRTVCQRRPRPCQSHPPKTARGLSRRGDLQLQRRGNRQDRIVYDAACQYWVNIVARFKVHSPDLVHIVKQMRWAVPALHIYGHGDECQYNFATCYMVATGHFHGESAEHYWPELNQIGPQVTQMSGGRRQDVITLDHNAWNLKKMHKSFTLLMDDLRKADFTYRKHRQNFIGLCAAFGERIANEGWLKLSREPDNSDPKYTKSVYRHAKSKIPSQKAIYDLMLADESAIGNSGAPRNQVAAFLNAGIIIKEDQLKLRKMVSRKKKHYTETLQNEADTLQESIQNTIVEW